MLESYLERKFAKAIKNIGGQALKFTSPGMAGVPDRLVLLPGGKVIFAELKKPGEKLRPLQLKRKKDLEALGFLVEVVDSIPRIEEVCHGIRTTQLSGLCDQRSD
ncbi:VRR-NUC domain-containing protein [Bacillus sp. FSL K6-3431]|uniref:VRR-NUC domain-containing protein n=1 Tax=Bacillus sp. FSL K6-3431 TaxID=2921500 RepID=UPI0030FBF630